MFFRVFNNRISEDNFRLNEMRQRPFAVAKLRGSKEFENISGEVNFFRSKDGIIVAVYVNNLPVENENCKSNIFGLHLQFRRLPAEQPDLPLQKFYKNEP